MSAIAPGSVHLLMADTALDELRREGAYCFTLCGTVLALADLPPWECPEGCTCEHDKLICPECVRRAAELSADDSAAKSPPPLEKSATARPDSAPDSGARVPDSGAGATR